MITRNTYENMKETNQFTLTPLIPLITPLIRFSLVPVRFLLSISRRFGYEFLTVAQRVIYVFVFCCTFLQTSTANENIDVIQKCKLEVEYLDSRWRWNGKAKKYVQHYDELYALKSGENDKFDATLECSKNSYQVSFWITRRFAQDKFLDKKRYPLTDYKNSEQKKLAGFNLYIFSTWDRSSDMDTITRRYIKVCNESHNARQKKSGLGAFINERMIRSACDRYNKFYLDIKIYTLLSGSVVGYADFGTKEHHIILHSRDKIWHLDDPEETIGIVLSFLSSINFHLSN